MGTMALGMGTRRGPSHPQHLGREPIGWGWGSLGVPYVNPLWGPPCHAPMTWNSITGSQRCPWATKGTPKHLPITNNIGSPQGEDHGTEPRGGTWVVEGDPGVAPGTGWGGLALGWHWDHTSDRAGRGCC